VVVPNRPSRRAVPAAAKKLSPVSSWKALKEGLEGNPKKLNISGNPGGHPLRSFYRIRTSLASAPAQRLF
jgi:hypothetical protein